MNVLIPDKLSMRSAKVLAETIAYLDAGDVRMCNLSGMERRSKAMKTMHVSAVILAATLFSAGTATQAASFRKGPYLIYPKVNTQMTVLWQADTTTGKSAVEWGLTTAYGKSSGLLKERDSGKDGHLFSYTITGFKQDTLYHYRVAVDSKTDTGSFRTGPAASAKGMSFYAYGDSRSNPEQHNKVCAAIVADMKKAPQRRQGLVLHTGDWVRKDTEDQWQSDCFNRGQKSVLEMMRHMPLSGCAGNHEEIVGKYSVFAKYMRYATPNAHFDYGPVHMTILGRYAVNKSHKEAYAKVEKEMSANADKRWKIAVIHQPAYTAGSIRGSDPKVLSGLCPLLVKYKYDVLLAGHSHVYSRAVKDGVTHITTGGGGAPLHGVSKRSPSVVKAESVRHFVRFDVDGDTMTITAIREDGTIIETVRLKKDAAPPPSGDNETKNRL